MSNKREWKLHLKRHDRKFLSNVTLAAVGNWFGWQVLCERGPPERGRRRVPALQTSIMKSLQGSFSLIRSPSLSVSLSVCGCLIGEVERKKKEKRKKKEGKKESGRKEDSYFPPSPRRLLVNQRNQR